MDPCTDPGADEVADVLRHQQDVVARSQALARGMTASDVARKVRRREWVPVHPGVYVAHTGPLTWMQRAWAAVLACWPAALDGHAAMRAHEGPGRRYGADGSIEIMVSHARRVRAPDGVVVRRDRNFEQRVQWNFSPPRMRYDAAVLDLADRAPSDTTAVAILADACGGRRTTAGRLARRAAMTPRLRRRSWLVAVLEDVADGTCSVLEHGYAQRVELAHGLPRGRRQVLAVSGGRRMLRDVEYRGRGLVAPQVVELDGRLFHDSPQARDRDLERDLDAALDGADTVRLGYGQVFDRPCTTAAKVGRLLQARGWRGEVGRCPDCPPQDSPGRPA